MPGITEQQLLLLWLMVERQDNESQWAPFWRSLSKPATGLGWDDAAIDLLAGTSAAAPFCSAVEVCHPHFKWMLMLMFSVPRESNQSQRVLTWLNKLVCSFKGATRLRRSETSGCSHRSMCGRDTRSCA